MQLSIDDKIRRMNGINFVGNIVPHSWFQKITLENGKPDLVAIMILSDVVYWYRPEIAIDKNSGRVKGFRKKFKGDLLQKSYRNYESQFGFSEKQLRNAFERLESLELLQRVCINMPGKGSVLFLDINPDKIKSFSDVKELKIIDEFDADENDEGGCPGGNPGGILEDRGGVPQREPRGCPGGNVYIDNKITDKITKDSLSVKTISESSKPSIVERNFDEREILKKWNEIVWSDQPATKMTDKRKEKLAFLLSKGLLTSLEEWTDVCQKIASSRFLMGEVNNFRASLDWVLTPENFVKITENTYKFGDRQQLNQDGSLPAISSQDLEDPDSEISEIKRSIFEKVGESAYKSWFLKNIRYKREGKMLSLESDSKFVLSRIETEFWDDVCKVFQTLGYARGNGLSFKKG